MGRAEKSFHGSKCNLFEMEPVVREMIEQAQSEHAGASLDASCHRANRCLESEHARRERHHSSGQALS
jgi:hypothetical protein